MEQVIEEIRQLTEKLLKDRAQLASDLSAKEAELQKMQSTIAEQQQQIEEWESSYRTLKIAKSLTGADDKTEAKQKINELVREIDKCITLLNK